MRIQSSESIIWHQHAGHYANSLSLVGSVLETKGVNSRALCFFVLGKPRLATAILEHQSPIPRPELLIHEKEKSKKSTRPQARKAAGSSATLMGGHD
mmetsp:Transcript_7798/g.12405  ORF Transcript_7798/g.12405 Transcript_7798/m.12405 type:complete len:97 (-) Transcript_7798:1839-2129(-)